MNEKQFEVAIVGGGIAGYSAALSCKSLGLDYLWLGGEDFGEKLISAEYVRNYPAFVGKGDKFSARLERQREKEEVKRTVARIDGIYDMGNGFFLTAGKKNYSARTVILATGVETAGSVKGERDFLGKGVSYCAVCDGALYRDKTIAVVISSPKFAEEVEYLAGFAKKVYCFCLYKNPSFEGGNVVIRFGVPHAVLGEERVTALELEEETLPVDGVFFLKNSAPPSALVGGLETEGAHVKVGRDCATSIRGMFAAGDVTGRPYQYVKAAGEGCVAAYSVQAFLRAERKA